MCRLLDCLTANYAIAALRTDCTLDKMESAVVTTWQWWAKLLGLLTVNSLSYFVKIKY